MSNSGNMNISDKHGMEREYEEMDIKSSNVNAEREYMNNKRYQTPRNTVRIRNYRASVVCLVLLCVLLLTAVIVLCVHSHTNKDLTKETHLLDGWIYYQSSIYFISSKIKSWSESRRYCTEKGADLIIINNREEQDFVKKISADAKVWIGLTDSDVEGTWKWVDGSTLTSGFWYPREPNGHIREDCTLNDSSGWADYPCSDNYKWICEKSLVLYSMH
ncbi:C-type lectin domain family 17, member A-like [Carassius auratus]|uniref:C-type lectin domain family 17, member A-like n=1 Tax=Carassius auratus TaxID=7957 RepID=A0A6P6N478_CARAU|nr:C-type lectin domain family 17, member A-like [Carassius auratus]XP_052423968.1 C-type lectin domain family 17, member A-like isoform X8 [Carassius gibelio]